MRARDHLRGHSSAASSDAPASEQLSHTEPDTASGVATVVDGAATVAIAAIVVVSPVQPAPASRRWG